MRWLDKIPFPLLLILALLLALAPFYPEPHLWQKGEMLVEGTLTDPVDIFDMLFHASLGIVVLFKLVRITTRSSATHEDPHLEPPEPGA